MQRTNLEWDQYIDYLIDVINVSKFMKRAENKPMATPKMSSESHISTRSMHLRESADIIKRIAKGLGLNENLAYVGMLMHDAGHPFSAHEGEELFTQLGEIYNTQYFHHNAKGVEIVLSENICGKAINKIPGIENNPELKRRLEEEFYYFLDVVVSHDGEASQQEAESKVEQKYETIKQAVLDKMRRANSKDDFRFIAETPEGQLAKYADVIAYLSSDMQDAFRLSIMQGFSDEYYELIGEIFATPELNAVRDKFPEDELKLKLIAYGKEVLNGIKRRNLTETGAKRPNENVDFQMAIANIIQFAEEKGLRLYINKIEEEDIWKNNKAEDAEIIIKEIKDEIQDGWALLDEKTDEEKEKYLAKRIEEFWGKEGIEYSPEQAEAFRKQILEKSKEKIPLTELEKRYVDYLHGVYSDLDRLEENAAKILKANSNTVHEITSRMKEFFINNLIQTTLEDEGKEGTVQFPHMSPRVSTLFFKKAKDYNYRYFTKFTNFVYQSEDYPRAAFKLIEECANSLVKSGAISSKFYDEVVRGFVQDPEALEYMRIKGLKDYKEVCKYKKEHSIGRTKARSAPLNKRYTGEKSEREEKLKQRREQIIFYGDVYNYIENQDKVFAIRYENTFHAIKHRVRQKIQLALSDKVDLSNKLYKRMLRKQLDGIRQEAITRYQTTELTSEQLEEFIRDKTMEEFDNIELLMAKQLCSDYLAGMTDRSFTSLADRTGHLKKEIIEKDVRGKGSTISIDKVIAHQNDGHKPSNEGDSIHSNNEQGEER